MQSTKMNPKKTAAPLSSSTIAAIATPPGNSGVGIVRISGPNALAITQKMFSQPLPPRQATLGQIFAKSHTTNQLQINTQNILDTAVAIYFKAPHSFTGEDIIELQCHGGWLLLNKVVDTAIQNGAVAATRGEFSRRAFLNGKLSLDQAEAIIETINAESDTHLQYASSVLGGALKAQLQSFEQSLIKVTAQIEATLDYPEHDIEHTTATEIRAQIQNLLQQIRKLTDTAQTGRIIANGINVAVLGKPNVGKSSIFNALLNADRSIVTEIPGTTTDTVTDSIIYNGIKIIFHDTAGIREGKNKIERLGIQKSQKAFAACDIALIIFDTTDTDVPELLELVEGKPHIVVYNKCDLVKLEGVFCVSAKTGENIQQIKQKIYEMCLATTPSFNQIIITNARHASELLHAMNSLSNALASIDSGIPLDCIATDIGTALNHIGNITGTHASEAVLDEIFSRFCLGK